MANIGVFKGQDIACNYLDKLNIPEFTIRTVTRKEIFIPSLTCWTIKKQQDLMKFQFSSKSLAYQL